MTSIDQEGTRRGFDLDLIRSISTAVDIPVIASGGMGEFKHLEGVVAQGGADAAAIAYMLHRNETTVEALKQQALAADIRVRPAG